MRPVPLPVDAPVDAPVAAGPSPLIDSSIDRIAVFRALALGDLLCATPALRAIKAAWPRSALTMIGLPATRALCERLASIDRFEEFPGHPGLPEITPDLAALPGFIARMQAQRFDLSVQMHGSGNIVNPLVASFDAKRSAGFTLPGEYAAEPALYMRWPSLGHEIERMLALVDHLGIARQGTHIDFPIHDEDRRRLHHAVPELALDERPTVCVHPGSQLPSRRWPPERFAAVADALVEGLGSAVRIVLTGTLAERDITAAVHARMRHPALDLAGRTGLFEMGALIERSALLLCNDTGVSHIAAALGTRSVVVSSGADVSRWAPLDPVLHEVHWRDAPCRPCSHRVCPFDHACALDVSVAQVSLAALCAFTARHR